MSNERGWFMVEQIGQVIANTTLSKINDIGEPDK
jgi:hypothetical protein